MKLKMGNARMMLYFFHIFGVIVSISYLITLLCLIKPIAKVAPNDEVIQRNKLAGLSSKTGFDDNVI